MYFAITFSSRYCVLNSVFAKLCKRKIRNTRPLTTLGIIFENYKNARQSRSDVKRLGGQICNKFKYRKLLQRTGNEHFSIFSREAETLKGYFIRKFFTGRNRICRIKVSSIRLAPQTRHR